MQILITGATGFLGSHLLNVFDDYDLKLLTRDPGKLANSQHEVIKGDLNSKLPDDLFDNISTVIHSAANVGSWPKDPMEGYYQTNVEGTRKIISQAIDKEVEQIIYTSSYFALGSTKDEIASEGWDNPPVFDHPYVNTKYQAGKVVDELSETYPITQLLPTTIIGPGINNVISNVLIDYINGELIGLPGGGKKWQNFVSASDVARAHLLALQNNNPGKYIIGGKNMKLNGIVEEVGTRLELDMPRTVPYWIASIYAWVQEFFGSPDLTRGDIAVSKRNYRYNCDEAKKLSFEPTALDTTIDKMLRYFVDHHQVNERGKTRILNYFARRLNH